METGIQTFQKESALPSESEFENLMKQAKIFIASGFLPSSIKTPEQAITIAIKGRELGIPPMQAFAHINVIQGKPAMSAELMLALCYEGCPTAIIEFPQSDNKNCVIDARRRRSDKVSQFKFNLDDALAAGLLQKDSWKKYPAAMLRARCISAMARATFPDCLMGVSYTAEELGADVTIDGEIKEVKGEVVTSPTIQKNESQQPVGYSWMEDVNEEGKIFQWADGITGPLNWVEETIGWSKSSKEVEDIMAVAKTNLDEAGYAKVKRLADPQYKAWKIKETKGAA